MQSLIDGLLSLFPRDHPGTDVRRRRSGPRGPRSGFRFGSPDRRGGGDRRGWGNCPRSRPTRCKCGNCCRTDHQRPEVPPRRRAAGGEGPRPLARGRHQRQAGRPASEEQCRIVVEDNGIGFEDRHQERIFGVSSGCTPATCSKGWASAWPCAAKSWNATAGKSPPAAGPVKEAFSRSCCRWRI